MRHLNIFIFCIFCSYDDEAEKITQYERIALEDLEKVEIGECLLDKALIKR